MQKLWQKTIGPAHTGWALLLALATAVLLRFWRLGSYPPGLYRDEAFNGLDALGVLDGQFALFFSANNGREPAYIYLTAVAVSFLGRTPLAVRLGAAIVGSATTFFSYKLAQTWFDEKTAVYTAWLWAITLWPIHLSRIGLRPILLPIMLALTFWLGTQAYRQKANRLWLLAGICYGLSYYTYLASRFSPILLALILFYLWWQKRPWPRWRELGYFAAGTAATLAPLMGWIAQNPDQILGRSNQVSILNPIINGGDLWGTLWQHIGQGLALFIWQGDTILRHNPAGRPLFDWLMALPFLIGVAVCFYRWKRPSAAILLLWSLTMLGPTILAEDTPHFLRAVGILPAVIIFPAIGLTHLTNWLTPSPPHPVTPSPLRPLAPSLLAPSLLAPSLLALSLLLTINAYQQYNQNPEVALLFEAAALELAQEINQEDAKTAVYLDQWFWDEAEGGWPTIPFITDLDEVHLYRPEFGVAAAAPSQPVSIYGWQFGSLDFVPSLIQAPTRVNVQSGRLARGDLEEKAYPLYIHFQTSSQPLASQNLATFGDQFILHDVAIFPNGEPRAAQSNQLRVSLFWEAQTAVQSNWTVFIHVINDQGTLILQDDAPFAAGLWANEWWRPGLIIQDNHLLSTSAPLDLQTSHFIIGIYDPATAVRLPVYNQAGELLGDSWPLPSQE